MTAKHVPWKILVAGLLATALSGPAVRAETAAASAPTRAANPIDPDSIQALKDMGAYLQTLKRFRVSTAVTGERVLVDGQKLQHGATAEIDVERPDKLRILMSSARSERQLTYDGKTLSLYTPAQKYYATVPLTGTIGELIGKLEDGYAIDVPLSDLFVWGTAAAPIDKIESAMNAGQDSVGSDLCDHYAFRQGSFDWQIWITTGSKPLPRKLVIVNHSDDARPQSVSLIDWNLKPAFNDALFKFTPPKGASAIEMVATQWR